MALTPGLLTVKGRRCSCESSCETGIQWEGRTWYLTGTKTFIYEHLICHLPDLPSPQPLAWFLTPLLSST